MDEYKEAAELFRIVSHPARLEILQKLETEVLCVSDIEDILGVGQSNVSQHLSLMRRAGLVDCYMDGKLRCYFLKDPRALDIVALIKKKYDALLPAPACCPVRPAARAGREVA